MKKEGGWRLRSALKYQPDRHRPFKGGSLKLWEREGRAVNTSARMSAGEIAGARSHAGSCDCGWWTRDGERKTKMGSRRRTKEEEVNFFHSFSIIQQQQL